MVLEKLSEGLKSTLAKIASSLFVDEKLINELVKDIQRSLLQADVNVKLVFSLTQKIKDRVTKENTPGALTKREHLINIVYEELSNFLGGEKSELVFGSKIPNKIILVGLFGSGKTTHCGKLAKHFTKRGKKVALVGLDVYRPAAMDQLQQVGKAISVPVFILKGEKDPIKIYKHFEPEYKKFDLIIIDTAGRDALSTDLIEELKKIHDLTQADETLLVISADIGQAAQTQAESFHNAGAITGVIITKMDGSGKGGGAVSAVAATGAKTAFLGMGEKPGDLEIYNAEKFVGRLLGVPDIAGLLEKVKAIAEEEQLPPADMEQLTIESFYQQLKAAKKLGPLGNVFGMMGATNIPKEMVQQSEDKLKKFEAMINSMTATEKKDASLLRKTASRIARIAEGSGTREQEVREFLSQFEKMEKMFKMFKRNRGFRSQMQKMLQGGMGNLKIG